MKRMYALALASLLTTGVVVAQSSTIAGGRPNKGARVGIRGSVNFTNFANNTMISNSVTGTNSRVETEHETGYSGGVFVNIPLGSNFSIEPAAEYARKGAETETSNGYSFKQKLVYIDVPLAFRYHVNRRFSILAGPQLSFFADEDTERTGSATPAYNLVGRTSQDFKDMVIGGRAGIEIHARHFGIFAQYQRDFTRMLENDDVSDRKNNAVQVGISYIF